MQLQVGRIQVGTQGTMLAAVLAGIAGYIAGQYIKSGKVTSRSTVSSQQTLTI